MSTLIIEINKGVEQWKMSAFEKSEGMLHRHYSVQKLSESSIKDLCSDVFGIFQRIDPHGKIKEDDLEDLRKSLRLLYDQIFTETVKETIDKTSSEHLVFLVDEQLLDIPWELLHDGLDYLCLKFAVSRIVKTHQKIHKKISFKIKTPLKVLLLCDPTGELKNAYNEGIMIRDQLDRLKSEMRVDLKTTDIDSKYVLKNIRDYDLIHFAGHARYDPVEAQESCWVLKDGPLTARKVMSLGGAGAMPRLVFANACSSGKSQTGSSASDHEEKIYGLANAFLLTGATHYIGTFWSVLDESCMKFSRAFYASISKKKTIGEALRKARLELIESQGEASISWSSYMLYGDPEQGLFPIDNKDPGARPVSKFRNSVVAVLCLIVILVSLAIGKILLTQGSQPSGNTSFLKNIVYIKQNGKVEKDERHTGRVKNRAYGKPAHASSAEDSNYRASKAVDRDISTRWSSAYTDPQWIVVDLEKTYQIGQIYLVWELAYAKSYEIQTSQDAKTWETIFKTSKGKAGVDIITFEGRDISSRYIRVFCKKRATEWGYSLLEFEVYEPLPENLALKKKTEASSIEKGYMPSQAVDGNLKTRWASKFFDPQWISVDLGEQSDVDMIVLKWEDAFGRQYKIQKSDDAQNWVDIYEMITTNGNETYFSFETPLRTRFVRVYGIKRGTHWGYSLWEFEVRGQKLQVKPSLQD